MSTNRSGPRSSRRSYNKIRRLEPTTSARNRRYNTTQLYVREHQALSSNAVRVPVAHGWMKYIHPEGNLYYYHPDDKIVTECNVENGEVRDAILYWRDIIRTGARNRDLRLTNTTEIALDLEFSEDSEICLYYLIDWEERREFWVEEVDTQELGMDMAISHEHLELAISEHFWTHVEYFPMHRPMPNGSDTDAIAALTHAAVDQLTSELSTAPWTATECERFLQILTTHKGNDGVKTCIVGRLWRTITHSQFINLYGHPGARLSRTQSILLEASASPSPRLIQLSRVLLFNAPHPYLEALLELWVDRVVYAEHWSMFVKGLQKDWRGVAIMGLLLVAVNVSLLNASGSEGIHHAGNIASTVFALSSVITAVLLLRRHRGAETYNAAYAGEYLERTYGTSLGHQPLAIVYSLPYALFLWSLMALTFTLVLLSSSMLFQPQGELSAMVVGGFLGMGILGMILYWSMIGFWSHGASPNGWAQKLQTWAFISFIGSS